MADNTKIDYNALYEQAQQQLDQQIGYKPPEQPPQADQSPQQQQAQPEDGSQGLLSQAADLVGRSASGAMDLWKSVGAGVAEAGLETKDFLFGEPSEADKSQFRKDLEARSAELSAKSPLNAVANDIAQFTTGMIGAGKLMAPIKAAQKLKTAGKAGRLAYEVGRGAAAGAVVIDPHEERLSNLVQQYPSLQNPVTEYLAAQPEDSAAEGRLKNALEGIGMDLALAGVFAASVKALKYFRAGDQKAGMKALAQAEKLDNAGASGRAETGRTADPIVPDSPNAPDPQAETGPHSTQGGRTAAVESRAAEEGAEALPPPSEAQGVKQKVPASKPISEPDYSAIIDNTQRDLDALSTYGSREEAITRGHKFAPSNLPWQKLTGTEEVRTFMDATANTLKTRLDAIKGGDVLSDAMVRKMVTDRATLFGEEPADLMGALMRAGDGASRMAADMEAAYLIGNRMLQDAYETASRIRLGNLGQWGGDATRAGADLKHRLQAAADILGSAQSMRAASGRTMRRLRGQFQISPEEVARISSMDAERLAEVLHATGGNPKRLIEATSPSFMKRIIEEGSFSLSNSLLWLWPTHAVNTTTNLYMLAARPTEKLLGSFAIAGAEGSAIRRQALKEYRHTLASMGDGWQALTDAFMRGDSGLAPHTDEYLAHSHNAIKWKPVNSFGDLIENGWRALTYRNVVGLPTRALGAVDEFMKTIRYRAVIQAKAAVEAESRGLAGEAYRGFIERRLAQAFDDAGRATDRIALQEAQTATFQQELLRGTAGATVRNVRAAHPSLALVLPFVKTPVNVFRYSAKMTPGLNLLQTEYRQMLKGELGREAQAQAVGQMALGATFMTLAGVLAAEGRLTGSGPKDPKLLSSLRATGWQPHSIVVTGEDGKRSYIPLGRFDPVGLPFGIMADLVDMQKQGAGRQDSEKGSMAVLLTLAKSFTDRSFLMNINQLLRAATDPETHAERFAGQIAGNALPLSSLLRGVNPDPYMREARGFLSNVLRNVPGYSETLPPRRDAFGEPIWSRIGLATTEDTDLVEAEHNRIVLETGEGIRPPAPSRSGLDLRDVTLSNGRNAYDVFQEYAAQPPKGKSLKEALAKLIRSEGYQKLVDGEARLKGTKLGAIAAVVMRYREAGFKRLLHEFPELRKELTKKQVDVKDAIRAKREAERRPGDAEKLLKSLGY